MMNNKIIPSVHSKESYFSPGNTAEAARIESRDRKEEFGYIFESIQDKKQADDEARKIAEKKEKEDELKKTSSDKSKTASDRVNETEETGDTKKVLVSDENETADSNLEAEDSDTETVKAGGETKAVSDEAEDIIKTKETSSASGEKKTPVADGRLEKMPGQNETDDGKSASKTGSGTEKQQAQAVAGDVPAEGKIAGDLVQNADAVVEDEESPESNKFNSPADRSEGKVSERSDTHIIASDRAANPVATGKAAGEQAPLNRPAALDSRKGPSFLGANMAHQTEKETSEDVNKLIYSLFGKQETAESLEKSVEIRGIKAEQIREKRNQKHLASFARRSTFTAGTNGGVNGEGSSSSSTKPETLNSFNQMVLPTSGSESAEELMSSEKDLMWKEHTMEISESKENNNAFQTSGFTRLEQMPVSNISIRRNVLPGLTQTVLKAADGGKSSPESWQKHNFVMDDGKNVQLSTRKIDGVLHVKLSSSFQELNRLLQQYSDEIREHLEKECDLKIDLQFDGQEEGNLSEFFGDSSQPRGRSSSHTKNPGAKTSPGQIEKVLPTSVRKFGYNQMEWTA